MLTNIKIALLDDNETASGDISVFGIELNLFDATYGESSGSCSESAYCGPFTLYCSATGAETDCVGYDYAYVQCKAWDSGGALIYFYYSPCP